MAAAEDPPGIFRPCKAGSDAGVEKIAGANPTAILKSSLRREGGGRPGGTAASPHSARNIDAARPLRQCSRGPDASRFAALFLAAALLVVGAAPAAALEPRATACATADAPDGPRLEVTVTGARQVAGNVTVTLYGARPDDFLARGGRLARQRIKLRSTAVEACFALSAAGDYAIAVYHDENDDHNFNRTLIGLPAEGYGFSNDAPTLAGLPAFRDVRFTVPPDGARVTIRLRY